MSEKAIKISTIKNIATEGDRSYYQNLAVNTITKFISPLFHRIFFAVCLVLFSVNVNAADDFPERATRLVTDYTGTLRPDELQSLENKLVEFLISTNIAVTHP